MHTQARRWGKGILRAKEKKSNLTAVRFELTPRRTRNRIGYDRKVEKPRPGALDRSAKPPYYIDGAHRSQYDPKNGSGRSEHPPDALRTFSVCGLRHSIGLQRL